MRSGAQPLSEVGMDGNELISLFEFRWRESEKVRRQCMTDDIFE
jgi:hypothetical protein